MDPFSRKESECCNSHCEQPSTRSPAPQFLSLDNPNELPSGQRSAFHPRAHGGPVAWFFKAFRVVSCLLLDVEHSCRFYCLNRIYCWPIQRIFCFWRSVRLTLFRCRPTGLKKSYVGGFAFLPRAGRNTRKLHQSRLTLAADKSVPRQNHE